MATLVLTGAAASVLGSLGTASTAAEVAFPKDKPEIVMEIPNDWTFERTSMGLEMRAPEKNSIIVASVLDKDRSHVQAWSKKAIETMKAFGIAFDDKAKVPPPSPAQSVAPVSNTPDFAKDGAFTFSGPPSLASPGETASADTSRISENSVESLTDPATRVSTKPKFRVVQYAGTTLNGKPVDVQFAIHDLPNQRLLLVMQESGPDDTRAVQIAKSVRSVK